MLINYAVSAQGQEVFFIFRAMKVSLKRIISVEQLNRETVDLFMKGFLFGDLERKLEKLRQLLFVCNAFKWSQVLLMMRSLC